MYIPGHAGTGVPRSGDADGMCCMRAYAAAAAAAAAAYSAAHLRLYVCMCIHNIILYICCINDIYINIIIYYACGGSAAACSDAGEYLCSMHACMCTYAYVSMYAVAHLELLWLDLQPLQNLVLFLRAVGAAAAEGRRQR